MSANLKTLTDAGFEADVLKSDLPVLVDFWAPWCGPCLMIAPVLERLAERYAGQVVIGKLNVDDNPDVSMRYGIRSIPTVALFINGAPVDGLTGAVPEKAFVALLEKHVRAVA